MKKINWVQKPSKRRMDSVWYGGTMITIETERYKAEIIATGEQRVIIDGECYTEKNSDGYIKEKLFEHGIKTDNQLRKAERKERVEFLNNNWYEPVIYDKKSNEYIDTFDTCDLELNDNFDWIEEYLPD